MSTVHATTMVSPPARPPYRRLAESVILLALVVVTAGLALVVVHWHSRATVDRAADFLARADYRAAVHELLPVVTSRPDNAWAHDYLGLAYAGLGARSGAIAQLRKSIVLAPGEARFHGDLGLAYREAGELSDARAELERAIHLAPREPRYRVGLAGLLLDEGLVPDAITQLRHVADLRPHSNEIRLLLARTLLLHGDLFAARQEYAAVERMADAALAELARQDLRTAVASAETP